MGWPVHTSGDAELPAEHGLILSGSQDGAEEAQRLFVYLWHNLCHFKPGFVAWVFFLFALCPLLRDAIYGLCSSSV